MTEFHGSDCQNEHLKLLDSIAGLQNRSEFHDVTFVCRDGVGVAANRVFLALRCEFFDRLLFGNLAESQQEEINFPSASSTSLNLVFEFLHTCNVKSLRADAMAVEAYDLARQYSLPGLQTLIVEFLVRNARDATVSVGEIISSALSYRANDVAEQLLPVASAALEQGKVHLFEGFSVYALMFSLGHESLRAGKPLEMDVFNAVLYWAIEQYTSSELCRSQPNNEEDGQENSAESSNKLSMTSWGRWPLEVIENLKLVVCDYGREESKDWRRVLEGVRFECIPTYELEDTVEKLGLVPLELLLKAYRAQAQRFASVALKATLWDSKAKVFVVCGTKIL